MGTTNQVRVVSIASIAIFVAAFSGTFPETCNTFVSRKLKFSVFVPRYKYSSVSSSVSETTPTFFSDWEAWWRDMLSDASATRERQRQNLASTDRDNKESSFGTIMRCAARSYRGTASTPSNAEYTTRKDEMPKISVTSSGIVGDYNHYRTVALSKTSDRAVSILTDDVHGILKNGWKWGKTGVVRPGDLGENVLVGGVSYNFFQIGSRYRIQHASEDGLGSELKQEVILEITEPIVPCPNLCKLPYINDVSIAPKDRITRCESFLERLAVDNGIRGWYAKVVGAGGSINLGDKIELVSA